MIWLGFIALFVIAKNPPTGFDTAVSNYVQNLNVPFLNPIMSGASFLGETWPSIILAASVAIWFWARGLKREAVWFVIALIVVSSATSLIKNVADRTRPNGDPFSFVSGHTSYFTVFGGYLVINLRKLVRLNRWAMVGRSLLVVAVAIIAFSRIYLGAHWATDVLGGFMLGVLVLMPVLWQVDNPGMVAT